jgi:hypothetical protein
LAGQRCARRWSRPKPATAWHVACLCSSNDRGWKLIGSEVPLDVVGGSDSRAFSLGMTCRSRCRRQEQRGCSRTFDGVHRPRAMSPTLGRPRCHTVRVAPVAGRDQSNAQLRQEAPQPIRSDAKCRGPTAPSTVRFHTTLIFFAFGLARGYPLPPHCKGVRTSSRLRGG